MDHYTEGNTPQACPACGNTNSPTRFLWEYGPHPQGDPWTVLTCTACGHQVSAGPPLDMVVTPADIRALAKTGAFEVYLDPTSEPSPLAHALLAAFREVYPKVRANQLCDLSSENMDPAGFDADRSALVWAVLGKVIHTITDLPYQHYDTSVDANGNMQWTPKFTDHKKYHMELNYAGGVEQLYIAMYRGVLVAVSNFGDCSMTSAPWVVTCRKADLKALFPDT